MLTTCTGVLCVFPECVFPECISCICLFAFALRLLLQHAEYPMCCHLVVNVLCRKEGGGGVTKRRLDVNNSALHSTDVHVAHAGATSMLTGCTSRHTNPSALYAACTIRSALSHNSPPGTSSSCPDSPAAVASTRAGSITLEHTRRTRHHTTVSGWSKGPTPQQPCRDNVATQRGLRSST